MISKKILNRVFIGLSVLILFGCASTPAPSASTSYAGIDLDAAIREAATQMETRILSGTKVALVSMASPSTAFSTHVLTRLESVIVSSGKLVVVDRANLDKVRAEQGFQLSGEVDDESAKSIGKLLGAGAIVTGSLTDLGDVYSLTLKAINIETATVAVSYLADLAKTTRIETLLASGGGAAPSGTTTANSARTQPINPTASTSSTTSATPIRYTVTFNANGASGTVPSPQIVQNGESITIPDVGTMTSSRGTFGGWNTRADGNGTLYAAGSTFVINANTQLFAKWVEHVYRIGDTGPAGGIIFFDKGNTSGGWRYLEAAPVDLGPSVFMTESFRRDEIEHFGFTIGSRTTATNNERRSRAVGAGKINTEHLMRIANNKGGGFGWAVQLASTYEINGFNDWFLPSQDELNHMYGSLYMRGLGNFSSARYWSSSVGIDSSPVVEIVQFHDFTNGVAGTASRSRVVSSVDYISARYLIRPLRQF